MAEELLGKIEIYENDTDPITLRIKENGVYLDLTGKIVTFNYKNYGTQAVGQIVGTIDGSVTGKVSFAVAASTFVVGEYSYNIQVTESDGSKKRTFIKEVLWVLKEL